MSRYCSKVFPIFFIYLCPAPRSANHYAKYIVTYTCACSVLLYLSLKIKFVISNKVNYPLYISLKGILLKTQK